MSKNRNATISHHKRYKLDCTFRSNHPHKMIGTGRHNNAHMLQIWDCRESCPRIRRRCSGAMISNCSWTFAGDPQVPKLHKSGLRGVQQVGEDWRLPTCVAPRQMCGWKRMQWHKRLPTFVSKSAPT